MKKYGLGIGNRLRGRPAKAATTQAARTPRRLQNKRLDDAQILRVAPSRCLEGPMLSPGDYHKSIPREPAANLSWPLYVLEHAKTYRRLGAWGWFRESDCIGSRRCQARFEAQANRAKNSFNLSSVSDPTQICRNELRLVAVPDAAPIMDASGQGSGSHPRPVSSRAVPSRFLRISANGGEWDALR